MMPTVERISDDLLRRVVWGFWVSEGYGPGPTVILDVMIEQTRPSVRHRKWIDERGYSRLGTGRGSVALRVLDEPVVPPDVLGEVLEKVRASVTYRSWETIQQSRGLRPIKVRRTGAGGA